jgi:hypothetical protein
LNAAATTCLFILDANLTRLPGLQMYGSGLWIHRLAHWLTVIHHHLLVYINLRGISTPARMAFRPHHAQLIIARLPHLDETAPAGRKTLSRHRLHDRRISHVPNKIFALFHA